MLEFTAVSEIAKRKSADAILIPCFESRGKKRGGELACAIDPTLKAAKEPLELGDFKGTCGKAHLIYTQGKKEKRLILLGLGKEGDLTVEGLRLAYASSLKLAREARLTTLNLLLPTSKKLKLSDVLRGVAEGLLLANESFDRLKYEKLKEPTILVKKATLIGVGAKHFNEVRSYVATCEGIRLTRDLINRNADEMTPEGLGKVTKDLAKTYPSLKASVFNKAWIEGEGMGLFLAVSRGSSVDPALITLEYKGNPKSKDHTVLVGKGVTYDTGGLNLKPTGYMETMKTDMSGAATVLGTLLAVSKLKLKVNVTAVIAATENGIDAKSYKPGDVYTSYNKKTVEIDNTDAEGRLTLADAIAYVEDKLKPTRIIDLATLTGAIVIALGEEVAGLMSNDDKLATALQKAGEEAGDLLWRLPLHPSYKKLLDSKIADIKNCGGRAASAITAGLFIQEFVKKTPWAHLDIAGTAYPDKVSALSPSRATGFGVRLLVEFLKGK